ncbi:MAG: N-acetylmuramoyl-L-alanine amidase [Candidatus Aenigmarchaeota archaeon]|nr:N-acetylmuramoyl-L-alanine amidase [Candidatus Aenigmarchaeota archaeon]
MEDSWHIGRRDFLRLLGPAIAAFPLGQALLTDDAYALEITDIKSPKRARRASRKSTDFIVLHTTEANGSSSLNSLSKGGKANYLVDTDGKVYRILNPGQVSIGCGRSMWNSKINLDNHALNIEFVGHHNSEPAQGQYASGRELIAQLQGMYGISDDGVMPHSQVAYGRPNKWHRRSHRGRKRCGMLFAKDDVRQKLGLETKPRQDPDVAANRLVFADTYLAEFIYGRGAHLPAEPAIAMPEENGEGDVTAGEVFRAIENGQVAWTYAGDEFADKTTIYMFKNGKIRRGDELKRGGFNFTEIEPGTKIAVGYVYGGHVKRGRSAYSICKRECNLPSTIYRLPGGEFKTGDEIDFNAIPAKTLVMFRE